MNLKGINHTNCIRMNNRHFSFCLFFVLEFGDHSKQDLVEIPRCAGAFPCQCWGIDHGLPHASQISALTTILAL